MARIRDVLERTIENIQARAYLDPDLMPSIEEQERQGRLFRALAGDSGSDTIVSVKPSEDLIEYIMPVADKQAQHPSDLTFLIQGMQLFARPSMRPFESGRLWLLTTHENSGKEREVWSGPVWSVTASKAPPKEAEDRNWTVEKIGRNDEEAIKLLAPDSPLYTAVYNYKFPLAVTRRRTDLWRVVVYCGIGGLAAARAAGVEYLDVNVFGILTRDVA